MIIINDTFNVDSQHYTLTGEWNKQLKLVIIPSPELFKTIIQKAINGEFIKVKIQDFYLDFRSISEDLNNNTAVLVSSGKPY